MGTDAYGSRLRGAACKTCSHPDRSLCEIGLARGVALRALSRRFNLSKDSLARHRAHHLPASLIAQLRASRPDVDPAVLREQESEGLLGHLVKSKARLWAICDQAELLGDFKTAIAAHAQLRAVLDSEAKLLGAIAPRVSINFTATPEYMALRGAILAATAAHPEVRRAIAAELQRIELPVEAKAIGEGDSSFRPRSSLQGAPGAHATPSTGDRGSA